MNKFAGDIVYDWFLDDSQLDALSYTCLATPLESWKTCLLIFGETKASLKQELILELWDLGTIIKSDISFSVDEKVMLLNTQIEGDVHEIVSFQWVEIAFEEIVERFAETYEVVAIREAKESAQFWNKVIKVDFIY